MDKKLKETIENIIEDKINGLKELSNEMLVEIVELERIFKKFRKETEQEFPKWIINGICHKPEEVICNLGYVCDVCPHLTKLTEKCHRCNGVMELVKLPTKCRCIDCGTIYVLRPR